MFLNASVIDHRSVEVGRDLWRASDPTTLLKLLSFNVCPLTLVHSLGTIENSLAQSSLHPPFRYLYTWMRSPLSLTFLQAKHSQLSQLFLLRETLQSLHHLHGSSPGFLQYVHISLVLVSL